MKSYSRFILKKIKEYDTIVVVRHQNSDMDALGTQFALKEWINLNFPSKKVYCLGENHNKYTRNFIPKSDEFDYEGKFLGICVDVNTIARVDANEVYQKADYKICIDHHNYIEIGEFDYTHIEKDKIACAEVVANIFFDLKKKMNTNVCKYLYAGICSDSGNFCFPETGFSTLKTASKLLELGKFNQYNDIHMLVNMMAYKDMKATNEIFSRIVLEDNGFAYCENSIEDLAKIGVTASSANERINGFNKIEEVKIVLTCSECEDHTYRCSIRSKNISVVEVSQRYGGGGHDLATGVKGLTKDQLENLKEDLRKLIK